MNAAIIMMLVVSGGFAVLAVLAAGWWIATGQYRGVREGASLPLEDDDGAAIGGATAATSSIAGTRPTDARG